MTQTDIIGVIVLLTFAFTAIGLLVYLLTRNNRMKRCKYCGKPVETIPYIMEFDGHAHYECSSPGRAKLARKQEE